MGEFFILFNQTAPTAETPFEIHVLYQGKHRVEKLSGFIEGVDMFMGKIPLFFKASTNKQSKESKNLTEQFEKQSFASPAMFGSCSLDTMRWRVMFEAEFKVNNVKQMQTFFIEFTSKR